MTKYVYDGDQIISEYNGDGFLVRRFLYGTGIDETIRMSNVLPSADIAGGGDVDLADFAVLAQAWLLDANDTEFDPNADLIPDRIIDYKDLKAIADNWLGEGAGSAYYVYYYQYDGLGSVIALSNSDGNLVEEYRYDVYGKSEIRNSNNSVVSVSSVANQYFFTGRQYDSETGLYYYRARYYSPNIGRFMQTDPVGYSAGVNWYAYCGNNPIMLVDPFGLCQDSYRSKANLWEAVGDIAGWLQSGIHAGLDAAGIFDPTGACDFINAAGYTGEALAGQGGWGNAAISAAAIIPYVGDFGKAGKYGSKALKYSDEVAQVGSYTLDFASGMKYAGKGPLSRAEQSARILGEKYGDTAVKIDWAPANSSRQAFKDEAIRLKDIQGPGKKTYNQINSPGKKYIEEDGF